jgi:hypothetical protein
VPPVFLKAVGTLLLALAAWKGLRAGWLLLQAAVLGVLGWWLLGGQMPQIPPELRGWLDSALSFFRGLFEGAGR